MLDLISKIASRGFFICLAIVVLIAILFALKLCFVSVVGKVIELVEILYNDIVEPEYKLFLEDSQKPVGAELRNKIDSRDNFWYMVCFFVAILIVAAGFMGLTYVVVVILKDSFHLQF